MKQIQKILLVEDDENLGFVIQDNLQVAGFDVDLAKDGVEGLSLFRKRTYALCLLDVMMPKKDGFSVAEEIRAKNEQIPIIFLTAKNMDMDRIKGFKIGADDYITKPFNMEELTLRIKAVIKRSNSISIEEQQNQFTIGDYQFNYDTLQLNHTNFQKQLTKKEAELLKLLCTHTDSVLERETALKIVWGEDDYFLGRSMDVFISKIRKYLSLDERIKIINVHGVGFKLDVAK